MLDRIYAVSSFSAAGLLGNQHLIVLQNSAINVKTWQEISSTIDDFIFVVVPFPIESGGSCTACANVFFFHKGRVVKRCGSGALALAHVLIQERGQKSPLTLNTPAGKTRIGKCDLFYYETPFMSMTEDSTSRWSHFVNCHLCSAHLIGGHSDYCVLELASEKALRQFKLNVNRVRLFEKRAVIATCRSVNSAYDYAMRYFAPQYGNSEDAATGSANAMLAYFWQRRLKKNCVRAKQLSRQGGFFHVQRVGLTQRVMGETKRIAYDSRVASLIEKMTKAN